MEGSERESVEGLRGRGMGWNKDVMAEHFIRVQFLLTTKFKIVF